MRSSTKTQIILKLKIFFKIEIEYRIKYEN